VRKAARERAEEGLVKNAEERKKLLKARKVTAVFEALKANDTDELEMQLMDVN
jgi:hypothetical protein